MTEQEKFLNDIDDYEANNHRLFPEMGQQTLDTFALFRNEVLKGHVYNSDFRRWITNLINYYGEKDRSYANYLEGLL